MDISEKKKFIRNALQSVKWIDFDFDISKLDSFDKQAYNDLHSAIFGANGGRLYADTWLPMRINTGTDTVPFPVYYIGRSRTIQVFSLGTGIYVKYMKTGKKTQDPPFGREDAINRAYSIMRQLSGDTEEDMMDESLSDIDFNPTLYGKRVTIKKFINDAVSYFLSKGTVPTLDEIEDYVTADRYVKANIYDRQFGRASDGFEFVPLDDLCKNIQNLVSFSQDDDMYESKSRRIKLRITEAARGRLRFEKEQPFQYFIYDGNEEVGVCYCGNYYSAAKNRIWDVQIYIGSIHESDKAYSISEAKQIAEDLYAVALDKKASWDELDEFE